jgi:hypothetical protein
VSSVSGFSLPATSDGFAVFDDAPLVAFTTQSSSAIAFAVPANKPKTIYDPLVIWFSWQEIIRTPEVLNTIC